MAIEVYNPINRPRHSWVIRDCIGNKRFQLPFELVLTDISELKKNDIINKTIYTEELVSVSLYRILRINKKSISVIECDQYGNDYNITSIFRADDEIVRNVIPAEKRRFSVYNNWEKVVPKKD